MALRAILEGLTVARRVEVSVEADRVIDRPADRLVPVVLVACRARRLPCRSTREIDAVALHAVLIRQAIARRMEITAEIDCVSAYSAGRFVPVIVVAFRA